MRKRALITGITGQDGSYLAELLLEKHYEVHGLVRRSSGSNTERIAHLIPKITLHWGDLSDAFSLKRVLEKVDPHEVYNLAAMSHVQVSFEVPEYTANIAGLGTLRFLDLIREFNPAIRFYQASTSELFGKVLETPQTEKTPFYPRSPYGIAKLYAYWTVVNYREAYELYACNGILFNHESPRRSAEFVSRKITQAVARIALGKQKKVRLGNLNSMRDWGHAQDYVEGMWRMLQQSQADDFILATGRTLSVRQFAELSFREVGIQLVWEGEGYDEKGINCESGEEVVEVTPEFFRPSEVDCLIGDSTKARRLLGWEPCIAVEELVQQMVAHDLEREKWSVALRI